MMPACLNRYTAAKLIRGQAWVIRVAFVSALSYPFLNLPSRSNLLAIGMVLYPKDRS
jgi:hypothetical protein